MLRSLMIRQIALIDEAYISFHHGLQVLTGETGAGKSIVVDAVNLILGGRADKELIRSGAERASVEAVFDISVNENVNAFLKREEIEYEDSFLTIYREITAAGKNTCRICGILVPLSKIRELSPMLMDLHGQSEHQFLADTSTHLPYLDLTGDSGHQALLQKTRECCELFLQNHRTYAKLVRQNEHKDDQMLSVEQDLDLLRKAKVHSGEAKSLNEKRKSLESAAKKAETIIAINQLLSGTDGKDGCLHGMKKISDLLKELNSNESKSIKVLADQSETLYYDLEDLAYQISIAAESFLSQPDILEKIDKRLELIHRLERRFKVDADELPTIEDKLEKELDMLKELGSRTEKMAEEHKQLLSEYRKNARMLTASRRKLAETFEKKMKNELHDLGMGNTEFIIDFKENDTGRPMMPTPQGDDRIEFLISPNPGEPLKPLSKIASGGELSRIMLAIKTIESSRTGVDSMVFDEIDTGISGRMAQVVAEKMIAISRDRQIICVTHLPQIAASADYHYLVQKQVAHQRTITSVTELDQTGRVEEISRMISGADGISVDSLQYGNRLLNAASEMKSNMHHTL